MIDTWLFFFILFISVILAIGAWLRSPIALVTAGVLFLGLGSMMLYSDTGITTDKVNSISTTVDGNSTATTLSYLTLTPQNDLLINILGMIFFFGGWLPITIGIAIFFGRISKPKEEHVGELG